MPLHPSSSPVRKVVLAYSGGLDTSVILRWLSTAYGCEVVTFTADLGQGAELETANRNAERLGIRERFVEDLQETFAAEFVFPMFRANALYESSYLLGTSIARPLIARRQIEIARETGADAVAHGATGKGNDQIRFELAYAALDPEIRVIAPWREWELDSREKLIAFAEAHQIDVPRDKRGEAPFSVDANLLHTSSEGKILENPAQEPPDYVFQCTQDPRHSATSATEIRLEFERGDPVALDGARQSPAALLRALNTLGNRHGIGRVDLVENRTVGMKSRGIYETPGGTILLAARRAVESLTLDPAVTHLREDLMPRYARLVYDGLWYAPERELLQTLFDASQEAVTGCVCLRLYRGSVQIISRESPNSLYDPDLVTFEEGGTYNHADATGFIRLRSLRLRANARRKRHLANR